MKQHGSKTVRYGVTHDRDQLAMFPRCEDPCLNITRNGAACVRVHARLHTSRFGQLGY